MKQRRVGASGLRVSRLGLGTSTWGAGTDLRDAELILEEFIGAGGTLIDSSPAYAHGRAQQMLAELLANTQHRRSVVISSSAGVDPTRPMGQRVDCSRRFLISQLDATLSALGTDYLDVWSVGFWDEHTPLHEVADTLDYAVRTGRVRYVGARGFAGWQLALLYAATDMRAIVAAQAEYSLLVRRAEEELLPAAQHLGVGFFAGAPLGRGVLTAKYRSDIPGDSRVASAPRDVEVDGYLDARSHTIVDALDTAATGLGISATAAALTWVRDRPGVSSVIVGARTHAQLSQLLTAETISLPAQITSALDDVSL